MVGFMSYYDIPNEGYLPCELGAVEYSLNGGILRRLHFFLPPGQLLLLCRSMKLWNAVHIMSSIGRIV